jgi:hypothetical protein
LAAPEEFLIVKELPLFPVLRVVAPA